MNKETFITILFVLVSMNMYTQQRISVRDSLTQEPIAYTSVWFGNEAGGYTDESGMIEVPEGTTIFLVPRSINLNEVAINAKTPKRTKTTEVGLMKTKTQIKHKGANGFEMALFIPYDSTWAEMPYIHSILASLDYSTHWLVFTEIKTPIYATLRFDLRLPDAMTGPSCQKLGKDGVSLAHPIPFPQTGVFVVVEWITTAQVSESCNLVPSLNMTLDEKENRTWNKKTFFAKQSGGAERRGMDWMQEQNEPAYQNEEAQVFYKGRTPSAKLGLKISE